MENFSFDFVQILSGFVPGLLLGFILFRIFSKKPKKAIASSADDSNKLQNEVLQDEVKHLQSKITTLEKALDMKLK
jgi:hypothetical protein